MLEIIEQSGLTTDTGRHSVSPFVKWAGGKTALVRHLIPRVPLGVTDYYEPFLGGGALFLALCRRHTRFRAFLSDRNAELIGAYQVIKTQPEALIQILSRVKREYEAASSKKEFFYQVRKSKPANQVESAARLIFLNKTCYNGLYRVNSSGEFNVPFGEYKNPKIFDSANLSSVSKALRETNAKVEALDYGVAAESCKEGDFVYLDPPYQPSSRTASFTSYTSRGFSEDDQKQLATIFARLVDRGCMVLLSNSDTPLIRKLYGDYQMKRVEVNRAISCVGEGRKGFTELLIWGFSA